MAIAVIGLGNISKRHRSNVRMMWPDEKIIAVSSSGVKAHSCVSDADYVLSRSDLSSRDDLKFAIVASPATFHMRDAEPLLAKGVPLYIEKPLAASWSDCEFLADVVKKTDTPVRVGYCLRFLKSAQAIKNFIESGRLGNVYNISISVGQYLPDWRPNSNFRDSVSANSHLGGGALLELSHELDYLFWLFGDFQVLSSVLRRSEQLRLDVEDAANVMMLGGKNELASLQLDFLRKKVSRKCEIVGEFGVVTWDLIQDRLIYSDGGNDEVLHESSSKDKNYMYVDALNDFLSCVNGRPSVGATLDEAKRVIGVIDEIKKNAVMI